MKIIYTLAVVTSLACSPLLSYADDPSDDASGTNALIINLGAYLGFDLATDFKDSPYSALLNASALMLTQQTSLVTLFGAIPVNAFSDNFSTFVPQNSPYSSIVNQMSNYTFTSANYNTPSTSGSITVNALLDQENYQNDPINQTIVNILTTPNYTMCMNNDATAWLTDCNLLHNMSIETNIIGALPQPSQFYTYAYNESVVPQLNGNTLIAPLLYTATAPQSSGSSSSAAGSTGATSAIKAGNQIQEAVNFIRYASLKLNLIDMPTQQDYNTLYATAISTDPTVLTSDKANAQNAINSYLAGLRTYAAQASVPISNLYYILSKRMPQQNGSNASNQTSQALSEFQMATGRIYAPNQANGQATQWIQQINAASPATVEKEIAILLAEINYQLYLNRQQDERLLLTQSMLLMQNVSPPSFTSTMNNAAAAIQSTTTTAPDA
jgi:intracellular multiplication protein IcmX